MDLKTIRRLLIAFSICLIICTFFIFKSVILTQTVHSKSDFLVVQHSRHSVVPDLTPSPERLHPTQAHIQSSQRYHSHSLQSHSKPSGHSFKPSHSFTPIPIHKKRYDLHPPFSKDLVVHTAYFDPRPRDNHTNVTVIFLNVNKTIMDRGWVVGCGVDGVNASSFFLYSVFENKLMHDWLGKNPFKYENMEVLCYDMPGQNGSEVSVYYKTGPNSREIKEVAQYPLFIPAPRVAPSGEYNFTVITCTKVVDKNVLFLHEFVKYQKTIGVDHVHVNTLDYFINDKGFEHLVINDSFLWKEYTEGYLTFSVWKEWYAEGKKKSGEIFFHAETLRKLDCMYRYLGTYDFAMPLDTDDFFVPRIPGKTNLKDYILQYCYHSPAGSCMLKWIWYYPQCGMEGKADDGNVTKLLKTKIYNPNEVHSKSVHSMKAIQDASFHHANCSKCLRPGYHVREVPTSVAYVAHIRYKRYKKPPPCTHRGPVL